MITSQSFSLLRGIQEMPEIYCYKCKRIPSILITDNVDKIHIKCEYCLYQTTMPLEDFIAIKGKDQRRPLPCSHNVEYGDYYCYDCGQWLCIICFNMHKKSLKYHKLIKINDYGNLNCQCNNETLYYCKDCKIHCCSSCKIFHSKHSVQHLKFTLDSGEYSTYQKILNDLKHYLEYRKQLKNEAINFLNKKRREIEEAYEESCIKNQNLVKLLEMLLNSYNLDRPNYYSAMNIIYNFDVEAKEYDKPIDNYDALISFYKSTNIIKNLSERKINIKEVKITRTEKYHDSWIGDLLILQDGRLASSSGDNTIKIYNMKSHKVELTLKGHTAGVRFLTQLNNGLLLSASIDCTIKIWDIKRIVNHCVANLTGHTNHLRKVIWISNERLASCSQDGTLRIWKAISPYSCLKIIKEDNNCMTAIELQNKKNILVTIFNDSPDFFEEPEYSKMVIFDVNTFDKLATIEDVKCCSKNALIEYKNKVISGHIGIITIVNIDTYQIETIVELQNKIGYICTFVNLEKNGILFGCHGKIGLLDMETIKTSPIVKIHQKMIYKIVKIRDREFVSACEKGNVIFWNFPIFNKNYIFKNTLNSHTIDSWYIGGNNKTSKTNEIKGNDDEEEDEEDEDEEEEDEDEDDNDNYDELNRILDYSNGFRNNNHSILMERV